jgi:hypothetical protein
MPMKIDDEIVLDLPDRFDDCDQAIDFILLVQRPHPADKRMVLKQPFAALPKQYITLRPGKESMDFFKNRCRQNHIADKGCLDDQALVHGIIWLFKK